MWLSLIWFISVLFVCWNLFCTIANLRIKCVTETKNVSVLFYKNLKSSFLHDSHIWLWGFFTLLVTLAHSVPLDSWFPLMMMQGSHIMDCTRFSAAPSCGGNSDPRLHATPWLLVALSRQNQNDWDNNNWFGKDCLITWQIIHVNLHDATVDNCVYLWNVLRYLIYEMCFCLTKIR